MSDLFVTVGQNIKRQRTTLGITQQELADAIGITRTSITNIEKGIQHTMFDTYYQIALYLGVPIGSILPEMDVVAESVLFNLIAERQTIVAENVKMKATLTSIQNILKIQGGV